MTKFLTYLTAVAVFGAVFFTGCGKYEEGPGFSLASKKSRVVNEWKLDEEYHDGVKEELTAEDKEGTIEFTKDDKVNITFDGVTMPIGTWAFANGKEDLEITVSFFGESEKVSSKILRLTKNEMWLLSTDEDGHKTESRYVSAN